MDDTNNGVRTLLHLLRQRVQNDDELQGLIRRLMDDGSLWLENKDCVGVTFLYSAIARGLKEDVSLLLANGSDLSNCYNHCGNSPLHVAANTDYVDIIDMLLQKGADVNISRKVDKYTPLHIAVLSGQINTARKLLDAGADLTSANLIGNTALHLASGMGQGKMVELLLKRGADLEVTNKVGNTPLANAGRNDHGEVVEQLLLRGSECNVLYSRRKCLLAKMMEEELPYIAIQLIRFGAHLPNYAFVKTWQADRGRKMSEKEMLVFLAILLSGNDPDVIHQMLVDYRGKTLTYPRELDIWLNANANGPLPLRMLCRQRIRQKIMATPKNNFEKSLRKLPLPRHLLEFLMLSDLCFLKQPLRIVFKNAQNVLASSTIGNFGSIGQELAIDSDC